MMTPEEHIKYDKVKRIEYFWDVKLSEEVKEAILISLSTYDTLDELIEMENEEIKEELFFDDFEEFHGSKLFIELHDAWEVEDYIRKEKYMIKHIFFTDELYYLFEEHTDELYVNVLELNRIEDQWIEDDTGVIHIDELEEALNKRLISDYSKELLPDYLKEKSKQNYEDFTFDEKVELYCILCPIMA